VVDNGIESAVEQALLRRAQQGDYAAYEQLHLRLEPSIQRFICRIIGDGQEAEDITQDTMLALYLNLGRIEPLDHLRPYTFRIARNACYDVLRRRQRYEEISIDADPDQDGRFPAPVVFDLKDDASLPPDEVTHWLLLRMEVQQAIDQLPLAQREALLLYCEEEMTYGEIANTLEISIGTVKSRLFHAKKTLRRMVRPEILLAIQEGRPLNRSDEDGRDNDDETPPVFAGDSGAQQIC
jgi:RNA polymerase sigma-70 factor (ECF subfamily)